MKDGFVKIATVCPEARLGNPKYNAAECARLASAAAGEGASVLLFPRLSLTLSSTGSLLFREELLSLAEKGLSDYIEKTRELPAISFIGLPVRHLGCVYDAVAAVYGGELLALSALGSGGGFSALSAECEITLAGRKARLTDNAVFVAECLPSLRIAVGNRGGSIPPSATLLLLPSSDIRTMGSEKRRVSDVSAMASLGGLGVAYVSSGEGESTNDALYSSLGVIADPDGAVAVLSGGEICYGTLDFGKIEYRQKKSTAGDASIITFALAMRETKPPRLSKFPFIPTDRNELIEAIDIQARALASRAKRAHASALVLGVSGGLDSTMALVVCAAAADIMGIDRKRVVAVTMPCFGTTERTRGNAERLSEALGASLRSIDIKAAVSLHLSDISHPEGKYDVVYENAQARERTQILMDIANAEGGIVVGTGDLSELALGFATYNGDHMSMYGVNASLPKTLMREMLSECARRAGGECSDIILDVIKTPISPELLPSDGEETSQKTEEIVGSYELHDFFIYHAIRNGMTPKKLYRAACEAFLGDYDTEYIKRVLGIFTRRFFSSQFKRSCLPDGVQITEVSLSPRGAWSMPSDMTGDVWALGINDGE